MNNYERLRISLDALRDELDTYVADRLGSHFGDERYRSMYAFPEGRDGRENIDVQILVNTMINHWDIAFHSELNADVRHLVHQVRKTRNRFAHQEKFDSSDTYTALHEIQRLLEAIGSNQAIEIESSKAELLRDMTLGGANEETAANLESAAESSLATRVRTTARLVLLVSGRPTSHVFYFDVPAIIGRSPEADDDSTIDLSGIEGSS